MAIILLLIVCSLGVASLFAAAFLWSVKNGQYDDLDSDAVRILVNNETTSDNPNSNSHV